MSDDDDTIESLQAELAEARGRVDELEEQVETLTSQRNAREQAMGEGFEEAKTAVEEAKTAVDSVNALRRLLESACAACDREEARR